MPIASRKRKQSKPDQRTLEVTIAHGKVTKRSDQAFKPSRNLKNALDRGDFANGRATRELNAQYLIESQHTEILICSSKLNRLDTERGAVAIHTNSHNASILLVTEPRFEHFAINSLLVLCHTYMIRQRARHQESLTGFYVAVQRGPAPEDVFDHTKDQLALEVKGMVRVDPQRVLPSVSPGDPPMSVYYVPIPAMLALSELLVDFRRINVEAIEKQRQEWNATKGKIITVGAVVIRTAVQILIGAGSSGAAR